MPAHKVVIDKQLDVLVGFIEKNPEMAHKPSYQGGPVSKQHVKNQWEELTVQLNAVEGGTTKTTAKWRDYWNERKYAVRKRVGIHKKEELGGIGPPSRAGILNPIDKRILRVLKNKAVSGLASEITSLDNSLDDAILITVPQYHSSPPQSSPAQSPEMQPEVPPPPFRASTSTSNSSRSNRNGGAAQPPNWILETEERRVAAEERLSQAMVDMASGIKTIAQSLERMDRSLQVIATVHLANQGSR